mgnify:CR=1 FL=1
MISFFFKFSITFIVSFIILSFKIDKKPLFYHVTEFTGPIGTEVQSTFGKSMKRSLNKSKELGENFLKNADPVYQKDSIKSSRSSLSNTESDLILEDIKRDEAKKLDELIQKN